MKISELLMVAAVASGCAGSGEVPTSVSGQIVGADEAPLGPGVVLFEKGKVHEGAYQLGALIDDTGHFTVELTSPGVWGIHVFHSDYTYLPLEVTVEEHDQVILTSMFVVWGYWMEVTGEPVWPDQPTDARLIRMPIDDNPADNPVIHDITMTYQAGDLFEITMDVSDPDGDLSRMILAYDETTGAGIALNPPGPPDDRGRYPNGIYRRSVFLDPKHEPGKSRWFFVVSDNPCNNTPVIEMTMPPR